MGNQRKSLEERLRQIMDYMDSVPEGEEVTQVDMMKALDIPDGMWSYFRHWLDLIIWMQAQPKLKARFEQRGGKTLSYVTRYKLIK